MLFLTAIYLSRDFILATITWLVQFFSLPSEYNALSKNDCWLWNKVGNQEMCGNCAAFATAHSYCMHMCLRNLSKNCEPPVQLIMAQNNITCDSYMLSYNTSLITETEHVYFQPVFLHRNIRTEIILHGPVVGVAIINNEKWNSQLENNIDAILDCEKYSLSTTKIENSHAFVVFGWGPDYWIIQNSWGLDWGKHGTALLNESCLLYAFRLNFYKFTLEGTGISN